MQELVQAIVFLGPLMTFVFQPVVCPTADAEHQTAGDALLQAVVTVLVSQLTTLFRELLFVVSQLMLSVDFSLNVLMTLLTRLSKKSKIIFHGFCHGIY